MQQSTDSALQLFASLTPAEQRTALKAAASRSGLAEQKLNALLLTDWRILGRPTQQAPDWLWSWWLILAGRGWGKTLTAAEWAAEKGKAHAGCRFALVAPTYADGRDTQVEGETGLLKVLPATALRGGAISSAWNRSMGELYLANGTRYKIFSSEKPGRLRGPQHHFAWCEEVATWDDAHKGDVLETTWSNLKLGLRLGDHPQAVITTTPKPNKLVKAIIAISDKSMAKVHGTSYENRDNLPEIWWQEVVAPYEGTRLGRQEIEAVVLDDVEGALWTAQLLDETRVTEHPPLTRVGVGVDPNASSDEAANNAGIIVAGVDGGVGFDQHGYVLADRTVTRGGPRAWAQATVDAYYEFEADIIVAEKNQGGEMVEMMIRTVDPTVPIKLVSASRGKRTRAEPIASMYEGSDVVPRRVHHVGTFPELEDEMTSWTPESESPDRMDAAVWILSHLMLKPVGQGGTSVPQGRIGGIAAPVAGARRLR